MKYTFILNIYNIYAGTGTCKSSFDLRPPIVW